MLRKKRTRKLLVFQYEKDDSPSVPTIQPINITSRHSQSITLAPMQLTSLKQSTTTDPIVNRLEKNGFSRPSSATPTAKRDEKDLKCLNAALELERNRLLEMIKTLQKRVDQSQSYLLEQENQLIEQKRTNNRLEKEFEKVKTDLNNVKNRTGEDLSFFSFVMTFSSSSFRSQRSRNNPNSDKIFVTSIG